MMSQPRRAHNRHVASLFDKGLPPASTDKLRPPLPRLNPDDEAAKESLDRSFARYAKSTGGVSLGLGSRYVHFDDAVRPGVPHWPPSLVYDLMMFHCRSQLPAGYRDKPSAGDTFTAVNALSTLRSAYQRAKGRPLPAESLKAGHMFVQKWNELCRRDSHPRHDLDLIGLLALSAAIWSPAYKVEFRQRFDLALYVALACATGVQSASLLSGNDSDGACWRDFALWMSKDGPRALFISRRECGRVYALNDGSCIGLSAGKLIAIGMALDGVIAGNVPLESLMSPQFWGCNSDERQVQLDPKRSTTYVFRDFDDTPHSRVSINEQLQVVSQIAGFDRVVTTGCFRRLVAWQVFSQFGLEIASAVLGHPNMAHTKYYLERRMIRTICPADTPISGSILPRDAVTWSGLSPFMRIWTIQSMTGYINPRMWRDRMGRVPALPVPYPTEDEFLGSLARWMLSPPEKFHTGLHLVSDLANAQYEMSQFSGGLRYDDVDMSSPPDLLDRCGPADYPDSDDSE